MTIHIRNALSSKSLTSSRTCEAYFGYIIHDYLQVTVTAAFTPFAPITFLLKLHFCSIADILR